ncbi:hypothetical protein BBP40_011215 [Aspergillus hancockii]|nr:hypothetical protein BBP40_011215 [Aspergillus hancockii]
MTINNSGHEIAYKVAPVAPGGAITAPKKAYIQEPVAVVGRSRFEHTTRDTLWHFNASRRVKKHKTMRSPGGMFLDNIDPREFEAELFGISSVDATAMDPQQRQLLDVVYECLENAGIPLEALNGAPVGCFVGSYSVDTACSGSLVSVDVACRYLSTGEIDGAIVAGANMYLSPEHNMDSGAMKGALSLSGKCHTLDKKADGYVKAEGVNAVVLKRLSDAIRDGDPIRAVTRGTATNSDGHTPGIASPSAEAQAMAIRAAYANAGLSDFRHTSYLEFHGTGTQAGDPTEVRGVASVFCPGRDAAKPLYIGSVKSNIGHSEPAAGISGLIKAVLSIENDMIPEIPHLLTPIRIVSAPLCKENKYVVGQLRRTVDFKALNVLPSRTARPWSDAPIRRASANSFGYGGSNAHVVVEEAGSFTAAEHVSSYLAAADGFFDSEREDTPGTRPYLLPFSANDSQSLVSYFSKLRKHLLNPNVSVDLSDLAYTLCERRSKLYHRGYIVTASTELDEVTFTYETGKLILLLSGLRYHKLDIREEVYSKHTYSHVIWNRDISSLRPGTEFSSILGHHETVTSPLADTYHLLSMVAHSKPYLTVLEINARAGDSSSIWLSGGLSEIPTKKSYRKCQVMFADPNALIAAQDEHSAEDRADFVLKNPPDEQVESDEQPTFDLVILKLSQKEAQTYPFHAVRIFVAEGGHVVLLEYNDQVANGANGHYEGSNGLSTPSGHLNGNGVVNRNGVKSNGVELTGFDVANGKNIAPKSILATTNSINYIGGRAYATPSHGIQHISFGRIESTAEKKSNRISLLHFVAPTIPQLKMREGLIRSGWNVREHLSPFENRDTGSILVVLEFGEAILPTISEANWEALKKIVSSGAKVLWVTEGSQMDVTSPSKAMIHGLGRTARAEDPSVHLVTLDVEHPDHPAALDALNQVLEKIQRPVSKKYMENEYVERGGFLHLPRILPDNAINLAETEVANGTTPLEKSLHDSDTTVRLQCDRMGTIDALQYTEVSATELPLEENSVEVELYAAGLNFKDVAVTMGIVPENEHLLGLEGAGHIRRVHPSVTRFKPGERVLVFKKGSFANRVIASTERTYHIPDWMTFEEASTLASVYLTAMYSLYDLANTQKGQANYAAANVFLDTIARYRRRLGLQACSVDLGAIEDIGYMSEHTDLLAALDTAAWTPINESLFNKIFRVGLLQDVAPLNPAAAGQLITSIAAPQEENSRLLADARFPGLSYGDHIGSASSGGTDGNKEVQALFLLIKSNGTHAAILGAALEAVNKQFLKTLRLSEPLEPGKPLSSYGMDSLAAVEFRNWARLELQVELTTLEIASASSLHALCEKIASKVARS